MANQSVRAALPHAALVSLLCATGMLGLLTIRQDAEIDGLRDQLARIDRHDRAIKAASSSAALIARVEQLTSSAPSAQR